MKARNYDRRILRKGIVPNLYSIQESNELSENVLDFIKDNSSISEDINYLVDIFKSGKEFGSLIQVENLDFDKISSELDNMVNKSNSTLLDLSVINEIKAKLIHLVNQAKLLAGKYEAVVTNPPYMNKFEKSLKESAKKYYKDYSRDLFSMFIYRNFGFCKDNGYSAFMTPFVWMFIKNYEKLRE